MIPTWKKYKLDEITDYINRGVSPSYANTGIPVINQKCIREGQVLKNDIKFHDREKRKISDEKILQDFDILICSTGTGTLGRVGQLKEITDTQICDSHVTIVRPGKLTDKKFLGWYLRYLQPAIESLAEGSTGQTELGRDKVKNLEILLPPLPEQIAIAEILSSLDDKIELNLQTNKTLEEMANALYKHWFVDFGPFKNGKFVESELGMIPEGFNVLSLNDVCFNHSKTFNFKNTERVIFINTGDILEGKFLHKNYSDVEGLPGQAKKVIEPNDILFSEIRPGNKRYALINFDASEYVVSTKFMVIRAKENILPRILYRILRDDLIIKEFQNIAESRSGTFPQITFDAINHLNFVMADNEVQNKFMQNVLPLENLIESNNLETEKLKQTRDYLLPKLISGEIRVKQAAKTVKEIL